MAEHDFTPVLDAAACLEYKHYPWGELISATKREIQSFGIAVGKAFPRELGGPTRALNAIDPRGFSAVVRRSYIGESYYVRIHFPGRERDKDFPVKFAAGVLLFKDSLWYDEYVGTANALDAAGLVLLHQLPGQPGMRKMRVTIFADGTIPSGAPTIRHRHSQDPGAKAIERASKTAFRVRVFLSNEQQEIRKQSTKRAEEEYEARMRALPRPERLQSVDAALAEIARKLDRQQDAASRKSFKDRAIKDLRNMLGLARTSFATATYSFDDDSLCEFERMAEELESVIGSAEVQRMEVRDGQSSCESASSTRLADGALQSFLRNVTRDTSLVENEKWEDV